jgi:microcystin-dependent protein
MACSNCYTGCTSITSDKCIKYTGVSNTVLGIMNGDSLNYATSAIMGFLTTTLDGTGIKYELAAEDMCTISSQYLTDCTDITVIDITRALSKAICDLDTTVTALGVANGTIEAEYTIPACIAGVVGTDGTNAVLQATMTQVCANSTAITATNLDLTTNYVAIADVNTYIADYVSGQTGGGVTGEAAKMVPNTVVEYYGSLTFFDATGAGTGDWVNIYLCNGNNGTPDKRGRVGIGTTSGMGGGTFASTVDPAISGNPTYTLYSTGGANTVVLTSSQLPAHTHTGTTSTSNDTHTHLTVGIANNATLSGTNYTTQFHSTGGNFGYALEGSTSAPVYGLTSEASSNHSHTFTTASAGGGTSHSNIQPVLACHYIMYIPAP